MVNNYHQEKKVRRIASNNVFENGINMGRRVVEITNSEVTGCHPLLKEEPFTEWTEHNIYIQHNSHKAFINSKQID